MLGYIIAGAVLGALVLLFMDVEVAVKYLEDGKESGLFLEVFYLNRLFKKEYSYRELGFGLRNLLPSIRVEKEIEGGRGALLRGWSLEKGITDAWKFCRRLWAFKQWLDNRPWLKRAYLRSLRVEELRWETRIGGEDAMQTGLLAGGLWAVKGVLLGYAGNKVTFRRAVINVLPCFDQETFRTSFYSLLTLKVAHVIIANMALRRILGERKPVSGAPQSPAPAA